MDERAGGLWMIPLSSNGTEGPGRTWRCRPEGVTEPPRTAARAGSKTEATQVAD